MTDFEQAARYAPMAAGGYSKPLNAWVENPRLAKFLGETVKFKGVGSLASLYGLRCSQAQATFCDGAIPMFENDFGLTFSICQSAGEMLIHVEFGPSSAVTAMTYWKR